MSSIDKQALAENIADYVETHSQYQLLSKREVAIATVRVLTDDIGAAQDFLKAIDVDVDLYSRNE